MALEGGENRATKNCSRSYRHRVPLRPRGLIRANKRKASVRTKGKSASRDTDACSSCSSSYDR